MRGVVAAGSVQSAEAGVEALRSGGNAVDAAVAAAFATSAGDPAITSLAGGGALIRRDGASGDVEVCDFFADAPGLDGRRANGGGGGVTPLDFEAFVVDFGTTRQTFHLGRGAAATPGTIPGLLAAWRRWGRLPLGVLLAPVVRQLRDGVALGGFQSHCIELLAEVLRRSPVGRECFFDGAGRPLAEGARFANPRLAATLERLVAGEPLEVYRRTIGPGLVEAAGEAAGGWLTPADLDAWRPAFREPLRVSYRGASIALNPAPSVGGRFVALTLGLLERAGFAASRSGEPARAESLAAAFRAVAELRDERPDLLEDERAPARLLERLRALRDAAPPSEDAAGELPGNTAHVSVVDAEGNAAGLTLSHGEGNGHEVGDTGVLMNNFLGERDLLPLGFHEFVPGERLGTMMAPGIVELRDGTVLVLGTGGSNRIRTALTQVISSLVDDGLDPEAAVRRARLHFEDGTMTAETFLEGGAAALESAARLAARVERFDVPSLFFGGVNIAFRRRDGSLGGAADPRRDGAVRFVTER